MFKYIILLFLLILPAFTFSLKISEVYFDWTNEFIGIYNDTDTYYSWEVLISGAKSSIIDLNISISPWEEIILGDNLEGISYFKSWLSLSISDTDSININLYDKNNNLLDSFFVSSWDVQSINNTKTSFEKIYSGSLWYIQPVKEPINNPDWYIINPWYVNIITSDLNIVQSKECYLTLDKSDKFNFLYVWDFWDIVWYNNWIIVWTGQNMSISLSKWNYTIKAVGKDLSGNICTWAYWIYLDSIYENIFTGELKIVEVHPINDTFPEYVELKANWNISWNYVLNWFWRWDTELDLSLKLYSGNTIVLAKSYSGFVDTGNILIFDNLSLLDDGEILSIQKDWYVVDNVQYSKWNSLYFSYLSGDTRYFEKNDSPTPWYALYIKDYYKINEKLDLNCSIYMQSYELKDDEIKINFDTNISDEDYCNDEYRQIWTYSWWVITWTCNPSYMYLLTWDKNINFRIEDLSGNILCEDTFNIFFLKENVEQQNLNCYIKVQSVDNYFLADSSINFITVVNWTEIQNTNTNYICTYTLSWNILSDKCNPYSLNLQWGLHKIDLEVKSNQWQTCQSTYYLNLPEKNTSTTKIAPTEFTCVSLSSTHLRTLVELIDKKYKTDYTKKKIFDPIKYLYVKDSGNLIDSCVKLNSDNLKILVDKIRQKYKSEYTLKKIFWTNNVSKSKSTSFSWYNLKIISILPDPEKGYYEKIVLSGQYLSWLSILNWTRKYKLSYPIINWNNYVFTGKFWLSNKKDCISLIYNNIALDKVCYINRDSNKMLTKLYRTEDILFVKDFIIFNKWNKLVIRENIPLISLKKKIKKLLPKLKKIFLTLKKIWKKYKQKYVKESYKSVYYKTRYLLLKDKYKRLKEEIVSYRKKKKELLKEKNKQIKLLKNQITFLRSFIVSIKSNIDKALYKDYLNKYRQVKKWQKIRY